MISLDKAKKIAIDIGNKLAPYCDVLNIAGSVRRCKLDVGDIEIVCLPKKVKIGTLNLFGEDTRKEIVNLDFYLVAKHDLGKVIIGKPDGRMMRIEIDNPFMAPATVMLDLFMPQAHDYFRQYAIRTGSADYSHKVIANGWLRKGWVGTSDGLRLESECFGVKNAEQKTIWKCTVKNPILPPAWKDEREFFDWLGVQYLPPHIRYV